MDIELDEFNLVNNLDSLAKLWQDKVKIGSYPQNTSSNDANISRTLITLESNCRENLASAKADIIKMLQEDEIKFVVRFDDESAESVYANRRLSEHLNLAFKLLEECYNK